MASRPHTDPVHVQQRKPKGEIKFGIQLNEEQKEAKRVILDTPYTLIKGFAGSGKANWIQTPILTPQGPKMMGDIKPNDYVISEEGKPIKVLDIFPQGKKEIHKITFSDGSTTHCTKDHLWNVIDRTNLHRKFNRNGNINKNYKKFQTLSLEEIINKGLKQGKKDKWYIPLTKPVEFEYNQNIDLDPYILGCLLGDGCLIGTPSITSTDCEIINYFKNNLDLEVNPSNNGSITYYISNGKNKKVKFENNIYDSVEDLKGYLNVSHGTFYKRKNNGTYVIEEVENSLVLFLKENNLYNHNSFNKFVPKQFLLSSIENRIKLLQGLLDTDGWVDRKKSKSTNNYSSTVFYSTSSKQLKDDIIYLVNSLGGVCRYSEKVGKYKEKGKKNFKITSINYRISISFNNHDIESRLFKLKRKQDLIELSQNIINRSISNIEYVFDDEAQCILVDSDTHLYLTDNFVVTHNTLLACQIALDLLFKKEINRIIITRPTVSDEEIGFLPGDLKEKMDPWLAPIYHNLYLLYNKEKIDKLLTDGVIEIVPFAFMRGRTFPESFIIVDECQNITHKQNEMMMGRLGKDSRMVFCGDIAQTDLKSKRESGISFFKRLEENSKNVKVISLKTNNRHEAVEDILRIYEEFRD